MPPKCPPARQALAVAVSLALANHAARSGESQPAEAAPDAIETIVVEGATYNGELSSGRFTAPLLDTPKSATIIPDTLIAERGATSLVDALKSVPGVTFNAGEGGRPAGDNLQIRGFDAGSDVFVDGIRDAGSQNRDIFALEQLEVVKGPGSAYTGRGSTGGSVNLVSKRARRDSFVTTSVAAGTDATARATLDANLPFGDSAAFRLNLLAHDGEIPGRNEVEFSHRGVATDLAFGIDAMTRLDISLYHYRTDDIPDYSIPYSRNADNTSAEGPPVNVDRNNFYGLLNRDFSKTGSDIASFALEHELANGLTLRNSTRVGESFNDYIVTNPDDSRANVANGFVLRNTKSRNSTTTTKANVTDIAGSFSTGNLQHDVVVGFEISNETMYNRNYSVAITNNANANSDFANSCSAPGAAGAASNYNCTTLDNPNPHDPWTGAITPSGSATRAETDTRSLYAFDTIGFNSAWSLNLGLRYDDYRTRQLSGSIASPTRAVNNTDFVNFQLGVVYKPAANGSIYLSTGTSSNPSGNTLGDGLDNLSSGNADLEPERNQTWELGTKWDLASGLSLTSAVFETVKENARVAIEPGRGAPQQTIGEQKIRGFEVGLNGRISNRVNLLASYTFLDSEITDDGPIAGDEGNEFPNTPRNSASLWTTFRPNTRVMIGGGATYVDLRYGNTANSVWVPDYVTFDAVASFEVNSRTRMQLNLQNLTDEVYFTRPYASHYAAIGAGRSALLSINLTF